jgi:D-alanine-D-alanine ligase
LRVAIAYNQKREPGDGEVFDKYAEFDDISLVMEIRRALESEGHSVELAEADGSFPERIKVISPEFVFNIAEGIAGTARESYVPAVLETLGIPFSGSGAMALAIALSKKATGDVLASNGIPVPKSWLCRSVDSIPDVSRFPVIAKPDREGSSKGITDKSVANDAKELRAAVERIISSYGQEVIVEQYLPGREFTVAVLGNGKKAKVLPIVEITFDYLPKGMNHIDSYEVKWIYDNPGNPIDPIICPARIGEDLRGRIERTALDTFNILGLRDLSRIDMRLDGNGVPNVIDINPLPGLIPDPKENSRFPKAAYAAGYTYSQLINEILGIAVERYKGSGD